VSAEPTVSRRTVLAAGVVAGAAGIGALAGCATGSKSGAHSGSDNGAGNTGTGAPPGGGQPAGGVVLAKVSAVPVGGAISASLDNKPILISQPAAGTVLAFSAICTHMGCTVAPAGKNFVCPCHGSTYDMRTGAVKAGPAPAPLPKVAVHVADGEVVSGS
jgi:Rieske Fe-S protein